MCKFTVPRCKVTKNEWNKQIKHTIFFIFMHQSIQRAVLRIKIVTLSKNNKLLQLWVALYILLS